MTGQGRCLVVMYHYVRDSWKTNFPAIKALNVADFEAQLDFLKKRFQVLSYPEFERNLIQRRAASRPSALLTFDDGFIDHYEQVWPILHQRGLAGVFFVSGSALAERPRLLNVHKIHFLLARLGAERFTELIGSLLERSRRELLSDDDRQREGIYRYDQRHDLGIKRLLNYELPYSLADSLLSELFGQVLGDEAEFARGLYLSEDMIRQMADQGQSFGWHTENHHVLSRLDRDGQAVELERGVEEVRRLTSQPTVPFCYPYGHRHTYDERTLEILAQAGYATAFNTVRRSAEFAREAPLEISRMDTKDLPPFKQDWPL